ncbi:diguanylate cyclase [Pseudoxanthomonas sp. UTMC 1351]|uniref:diguanylate cyclase n=1 Tax=Pseudoxanthomonas sp. UTMC 1351 TaxID=2695853 RepID=UPI0034D00449
MTSSAQYPTDENGETHRLPRRIYRLRVLGMALASLCVAAVLHDNQAPLPIWLWLLFTGLVWPQLALLVATRSETPYHTEIRNLLFDSTLVGMWVALMQFNLLPSVLLITLATVDKISTGIQRLWLWSLGAMALGCVSAGLFTDFAFRPATSMQVLLACLPMLLIHSIAVSHASHRLVREVKRQNRMQDELSRVDVLTGLDSRRYWLAQAEHILQHRHDSGETATLLMIDVDHFKSINQAYGPAVGDEVLRAVATVIRGSIRNLDKAGRFGGDEFGLVLQGTGAQAAQIVAERIRHGVEAIATPGIPELRCTVSMGIAEAAESDTDMLDWLESAGGALYRAKAEGRNRVVCQPTGLDGPRVENATR